MASRPHSFPCPVCGYERARRLVMFRRGFLDGMALGPLWRWIARAVRR